MIRVERHRVRIPQALTGPDSPAAKELAEVLRHHAAAVATSKKSRAAKKSFSFKVYSRQEIKDALAELFHGKCAYCETPYAATQPVDVEHFRPKAGVDEDKKHPGYYWLAASWDNLLPSCIDCNRVRNQRLFPGQGEPPREIKLGKGNRFPLEKKSQRAVGPDDTTLEQPLLLDPCRDDPASALEFTDDGIVHPGDSSSMEERARMSIEVYGLNRTGLVLNRLEVLRLIQGRMYSITCLVKVLNEQLEQEIRGLIEDLLSHELAELEGFRKPQRPYSLMCTQVIDRFMAVLMTGPAGINR